MTIELLGPNALNEDIQHQISILYKQLNSDIEQLPLSKILEAKNNTVIVICKIDSTIIGIAMMAMYKVISGYKGMIEDVVVSHEHRGKGIGRKLMNELVNKAKELQLSEVLLFSGHHRTAAIKLYTSMGFVLKNSGLYRLSLNSY